MLKVTDFQIEPFSLNNSKEVYEFVSKYNKFYNLPYNYFLRATLNDPGHNDALNLVLKDTQTRKVIAVFLSTVRDIDYGLKCFIKIFLIAKEYRRKGLGSSIISEILIKLKDLAIPLISYGASPPRYWEPGLDLRHTELYFFFKKHKFRERGLRFNLTVDLNTFQQQPKSQLNDFKFMRARVQDLDDLYLFVKNNFPSQVWPEEVKTSFDFDPPNTFVAKDMNEKIVGWATYSNFYPGSFGPTGVVQTLHGKGLGKELLYWCLDAIKMSGLDICTIMWVTGDTRKFYSKAAGAYIHPIYYVLERKIK